MLDYFAVAVNLARCQLPTRQYCMDEVEVVDLNLEQRIAFAAIQWVNAKQAAAHLWDLRHACECERSETLPYEDRTQETPCWKDRQERYDGDSNLRPEAEWCAACRKRQAIHLEYRKATAKRGARQRELQRLCGLAGGWQIAPDIKLLRLKEF